MKKNVRFRSERLAAGTAFCAVLAFMATMAPVAAQDKSPGSGRGVFVEGHFAGNFVDAHDLTFINPVGAAVTLSQRRGNEIVLENEDSTDESLGAKAGVGYKFGNNVFARGTYSYIDSMTVEGFARFAGGNFRQDLEFKAHTVMAEIGYSHPLSKSFFLEGHAGVGLSIIDAKGFQGKNLNDDNYFPGETRTNPAFGAGIGVGYRISDAVSVLLSGDYTYLGRVSTDRTKGTEGGINPSEQLTADLSLWRAMIGLRYGF